MGFFWIGCNHVSHGLKEIKPGKRLILELVSLVLLLITWCFTIPGIFLYKNTGVATHFMNGTLDFWQLMNIFTTIINMIFKGENGEEVIKMKDNPNEGPSGVSIFKALGHYIFAVNCAFYTIITAVFLVLNIIYRREYLKCGDKPVPRNTEWADRPKRERCFALCCPWNGLRMFHHLEHRAGFIVFLVCAILGVELYFTIPLILLTFAQIIISYLYAEDIMLCALPICCVNLYFIRRYPQEEFGGMEHKMDTLTV